MPTKKIRENLTKVVSSIISKEDFEILEKYAKVYYTQNLLKSTDYFTHVTIYFEQLGRRNEKDRATALVSRDVE